MRKSLPCPDCGQPTDADASACTCCGHTLLNGTGPHVAGRPNPPPEAAEWRIEPTPPEVMDLARQSFDLEQYQAGVREVEETGGLHFEGFIEDLERAAGEHE